MIAVIEAEPAAQSIAAGETLDLRALWPGSGNEAAR